MPFFFGASQFKRQLAKLRIDARRQHRFTDPNRPGLGAAPGCSDLWCARLRL